MLLGLSKTFDKFIAYGMGNVLQRHNKLHNLRRQGHHGVCKIPPPSLLLKDLFCNVAKIIDNENFCIAHEPLIKQY